MRRLGCAVFFSEGTPMDLVEQFVRSYAQRTTQNGEVVIITNGDPLLQAAFKHLGWSDPYIDPDLLPKKPVEPTAPRGRHSAGA
jgi:hypothetical protein